MDNKEIKKEIHYYNEEAIERAMANIQDTPPLEILKTIVDLMRGLVDSSQMEDERKKTFEYLYDKYQTHYTRINANETGFVE